MWSPSQLVRFVLVRGTRVSDLLGVWVHESRRQTGWRRYPEFRLQRLRPAGTVPDRGVHRTSDRVWERPPEESRSKGESLRGWLVRDSQVVEVVRVRISVDTTAGRERRDPDGASRAPAHGLVRVRGVDAQPRRGALPRGQRHAVHRRAARGRARGVPRAFVSARPPRQSQAPPFSGRPRGVGGDGARPPGLPRGHARGHARGRSRGRAGPVGHEQGGADASLEGGPRAVGVGAGGARRRDAAVQAGHRRPRRRRRALVAGLGDPRGRASRVCGRGRGRGLAGAPRAARAFFGDWVFGDWVPRRRGGASRCG